MPNESDDLEENNKKCNSRKRKSFGRLRDVQKKLKLQSHERGEACNCSKKCFDSITENEMKEILRNMNSMKNNDEVNLHLGGLISVLPVQRRRPRKCENEAQFRDCSVFYRVRVKRENNVEEIQVCKKAFICLHGTTRGKIDCLVTKIKNDCTIPRDFRGTHKNRPHKMNEDAIKAVHEHINSFQSRNSHYSLKKSDRIYVDDSLNIRKMFDLYIEKYPDFAISYESYRTIFNNDFNIGFGYPRSDTCSTCDKLAAEKKSLKMMLAEKTDAEEENRLHKEIDALEIKHQVHLRKQQTFYERKRKAKENSMKCSTKEAITMDYSRNFPCPNIETNDVYYKRQLSVFIFNIHVLSSGASYFYIYPETVGNKGASEVCSFLFHFVCNFLEQSVSELEIFCDSCPGQNKNSTLIKFCHHLVLTQNRLSVIKFTYPIRGHSYLECDKNTALINKKARCEIPSEWCQEVEGARLKPAPFVVVRVEDEPDIIKSWTEYLDLLYQKQLPFPTRPVRELLIENTHPILIKQRTTYNGAWEQVPVKPPNKRNKRKRTFPLTERQMKVEELQKKREMISDQIKNLKDGEMILPEPAYEGKENPISCNSISLISYPDKIPNDSERAFLPGFIFFLF